MTTGAGFSPPLFYSRLILNIMLDKDYGGINARPGQKIGMTIQEVKDFIKAQKRIKGFSFDVVAGDNTGLQIQLPGTAKVLLGIICFPGVPAVSGSNEIELKINNEIAIEQTPARFLSADVTDNDFIYLPRPLSGNDDISININNVTVPTTVELALYYI